MGVDDGEDRIVKKTWAVLNRSGGGSRTALRNKKT